MSFSLDQPAWLWLVVVGLMLAALGWRWMRTIPRGRRLLAVSLRVILFLVLGLTLGGVYRVERVDRLAAIAVVDVSGSVQNYASLGVDDLGLPITIDRSARGFLRGASVHREPTDLLGIVAFDGQVSTVALPSASEILDRPIDLRPIDGSDLVGAIRQAQMQIPADASGRLVVFSDGRSTTTGLDSLSSDLPIDVVPIRYRVNEEVVVEAVDLPARSLPGSMVDVRVVLKSADDATGELELTYQGEFVDLNGDEPGVGRAVSLRRGHQVVILPVQLGAGRVHRFQARFVPERSADSSILGDTSLANNTASGVTLTSGEGRVLVLVNDPEARPHEAQVLTDLLEESPWQTEIRMPGQFPTDLLELEAFDLIVLVNTPRDALDLEADGRLNAFVEDFGGGLLWIGGKDAFGAGGWMGSEIERVLPVALDVPDDLIMPKVAAVFVLDSSGSMKWKVMGSSRSQQIIANEAAAGAIDVLDQNDLIGVVSFSNDARSVVDLAKNDQPELVKSRVNSISSGGGTNMAPALNMAGNMLLGVEAETKHIVLLSDGESQTPELLPQIAEQLKQQGIVISTIAVGDDADEAGMKQLAQITGGTYYRVRNPSVLPRVFLKVIRVIRTPMVREGTIKPVVLVEDTSATGYLGDLPPLGGLAVTQEITDDPRISTPIVSERNEPIFAFHQVELGRVAVWTSDLSQWSQRWIESGQLVGVLNRAIGWTKRNDRHRVGELTFDVVGSSATITFDATDEQGLPIDGLSVAAEIFDDQGAKRSVGLIQFGSGQYQARISQLSEGVHVVIAQPMRDNEPMYPTIAGLQVSGVDEYAYFDADPQALIDLAARTGGRVYDLSDPASADLFDRSQAIERFSFEPVWPILLWITVILFLLDLAARRVAFDRWIAQARDETIAVTRSVRAEQVEQLKASRTVAQERQPDTPDMDRSPMRAVTEKPSEPVEKPITTGDPEDSSPLLAAKRRARERMEED
ncbi:MAG: VWA domain-containing protein [Phycisphaerales bacterium]